MLRKPLAAAAVAALAAAALAAPAAASTKPTSAQARAITRAVQTTPLGDANKLPKSWYRVTDMRISSLSPSWAIAGETATKAGEGRFQPAIFILVQPQGSKRWTVVSLGTALVGCGVAPNVVLADLMGDGATAKNVCPPGEGIKGS